MNYVEQILYIKSFKWHKSINKHFNSEQIRLIFDPVIISKHSSSVSWMKFINSHSLFENNANPIKEQFFRKMFKFIQMEYFNGESKNVLGAGLDKV